MTNLFLYYYAKKWHLQIKKRDLRNARIFSNIFRFVDTLFTFSNHEFENSFNDICTDELELKKKNEDYCKA